MNDRGIGSWPARRARRTPHATAVVHGGTRLDYAALHERVLRAADALRTLGVRRGDRVAYLGPNHPAFLETLFAAGTLGAVLVPLNTRLAAPELAHCLSDSGSDVLVHGTGYAEAARAAGTVRRRVGPDAYEELLAAASPEPVDEPVGLDDPCMIMYTSGTTGRAKGALLTHGNITWNSLNVLVDTDLAGDEVTLVVAPLFHTAALNMTCLPTLLKGGAVVLMEAFDPGGVLAAVERHRVTHVFGVPVMYDAIRSHPGWRTADLSSLRRLGCGGAPVPVSTIRAYQERGLTFTQGYGMTEAAPGVLQLSDRDSVRKAGTAGVPHFFTDVRVAAGDGRDAAPGEPGEVLVRGPNVMRGYWGGPRETARAVIDGWLRTGDVATVDADGFVSVVDRVKDMIISGGENIYPAEVEAALAGHPDVADCAVIGVADARWGEVGRAVVVPAPGRTPAPAELAAFLRERLAGYKVPASFVFTAELPRNPAGKLLKAPLRARHGDAD